MIHKTEKLGLKENLPQFILLLVVNAFVGGMIGIERTIIPQFASENFNISSKSAILSFIIAFGITKALTNFAFGKLANFLGRKKLLIIGWLFAIPVPLILIDKDYKSIKPGKLGDLAPTILKMMDVNIPADMTGDILV